MFVLPAAIVGVLLFTAIGGVLVRELWNWLLPGLFGWPALGFWQALGLLALCRILFGGLGGRGFRPRYSRRWAAMTPEERARFREGMAGRCGGGAPPSAAGSGVPD
jgi:hypothetical protein